MPPFFNLSCLLLLNFNLLFRSHNWALFNQGLLNLIEIFVKLLEQIFVCWLDLWLLLLRFLFLAPLGSVGTGRGLPPHPGLSVLQQFLRILVDFGHVDLLPDRRQLVLRLSIRFFVIGGVLGGCSI
jgi:hypothetical protein